MTKRIIEINGVKVEVDLRSATQVQTFRVGQPVRLLMKKWSENYESYPAVICGFDNFVNRPSIRVLYVTNAGDVETLDIADGSDHEITTREDVDHLINRESVLSKMNRTIETKTVELEELKAKQMLFIEQFGKFFSETESKMDKAQ